MPPRTESTTIICATPIDEATRRAIEDLLKSAGHDMEVLFIDHAVPRDALRDVRIVRKQVSRQD